MIEIRSIIIKVPDETKHMHMFCHKGIEALDERELRVVDVHDKRTMTDNKSSIEYI